MYKNILYILFVSAMGSFPSQAQEKKVDRANNDFDQYAYPQAIGSYQKLVEKGMSSGEIYKKLGDANYYNARYSQAALWYEKLYALADGGMESEYRYRYALTLKSLGKYPESDSLMESFRDLEPRDNRALQFHNNPGYREDIRKNSGRYTIRNLTINSDRSDYAPAIYRDQLVFSSARDTGIASRNINEWDGNPFNNLYAATMAENGEPVGTARFSPDLSTRAHEASAVFTKDGGTIYFTRNNSKNGKFARDGQGVSRLKIYRAHLDNGKWTDITELPFNGDAHSAAHPSLSPDERTLYFASDMKGTMGASDIFSVAIGPDGSYGEPKNLGATINTESRETFPFVSADNILYFASDGHPGLGGLDVFAAPLEGTPEKPVLNLGGPINGTMDDFSYIIDVATHKGYFASNRKGGAGSDDIYGFERHAPLAPPCDSTLAGTVRDSATGEVLPGTGLVLLDAGGTTIAKGISAWDGTFSMEADCTPTDLDMIATKTGYVRGNATVTIGDTAAKALEILLSPTITEAEIGADLALKLDLGPIYFDLDRATITKGAKVGLNKVMDYLKQYPRTAIEIRSHTDARGDARYNLELSKKRARATMEYLVQQGIDHNRLSSKGFGEERPTNHCSNNTLCDEREHLKNRRSEFIVTE